MQQELQTCLQVPSFDMRPSSGSHLDLSALALDKNEMVRDNRDFVFYGRRAHHEGFLHFPPHAALHRRNDMQVDLSKLPQSVEKVVFALSAYDSPYEQRKRGDYSTGYGCGPQVMLADSARFDAKILFSFALPFFPNSETAVAVGCLSRADVGWLFTVGGRKYVGGLRTVCLEHGVDVD